MTGLLICAAVAGGSGAYECLYGLAWWRVTLGLALIAVALWLAYAAGGA